MFKKLTLFSMIVITLIISNGCLSRYEVSVDIEDEGMGTVFGAGKYGYGQEATLEAKPAEGYVFIRWLEDDKEVSQNPTYILKIKDDVRLTAEFAIKTYEITLVSGDEDKGIVSGAGTYSHGERVTVKADPKKGYALRNWTENGEEASTYRWYSFVVKSDRQLIAHFKLQEYQVSVEANIEEAGITAGAGIYEHGQEVTLKAQPKPGYAFAKWTMAGQEVSTEESYTVTVFTDMQFKAHYTNLKLEEILIRASVALTEKRWAEAGLYLEQAESLPGAKESWIRRNIADIVDAIEGLKTENVVSKERIAYELRKLEPLSPREATIEIIKGDPKELYGWFQSLAVWHDALFILPANIARDPNIPITNLLFEAEGIQEINSLWEQYFHDSYMPFYLEHFELDQTRFYYIRPTGWDGPTASYILTAKEFSFVNAVLQEDQVNIILKLQEPFIYSSAQGITYQEGYYQLSCNVDIRDDGSFRVKNFYRFKYLGKTSTDW